MKESKKGWDVYADEEYNKYNGREDVCIDESIKEQGEREQSAAQDQADIISHLIERVGELREENAALEMLKEENAALKHLNKLLADEIANS